MKKKAIVLLSGGLDSTTCLAIAIKEGYEVYSLSFRYGQRHETELLAARRVADALGVARHVVIDFNLREFGGSALTADVPVPKNRGEDEIGGGVPITYVPARNTIFLSFALGWAEVLGAFDLFIGVNALDYSGYPDCRPQFIEGFTKLAQVATKAGSEGTGTYRIHAPLMKMTKADIVRAGIELGVDFSLTFTCYDPAPTGESCGTCDSCLLRKKGFAEAGLVDPIRYVNGEKPA